MNLLQCHRGMLWTGVALALLLPATSWANVTGSDTRTFNPKAHASSFVTVHGSAPVAAKHISLGLFFDHARNSLPYAEGVDATPTDQVTGADLAIGWGVLNNFDLSLNLPFAVAQGGTGEEDHGEFKTRGNTDVLLGAKWRAIKSGGFGLAAIASATINRLQENPHTGTATGPSWIAELAADYSTGMMQLALNLGYRVRSEGESVDGSLIDPLPNQVLASAAGRYNFTPQWAAVAEIYTAQTNGEVRNETDRNLNNGEALIGARFEPSSMYQMHAGVSRELWHGLGTPDLRIYAGATTVFGPSPEAKPKRKIVKKKKRRKRARLADTEPAPPTVPAFADLPEEEPDQVFIVNGINFEFDSDYRVRPGAFTEINRIANQVGPQPARKLVVEGHTDWMGSDEYNEDLSLRRARTVRRYLIKKHGYRPQDIIAVGYGERQPVATNETDDGRWENRRVEIKIYDGQVGE